MSKVHAFNPIVGAGPVIPAFPATFLPLALGTTCLLGVREATPKAPAAKGRKEGRSAPEQQAPTPHLERGKRVLCARRHFVAHGVRGVRHAADLQQTRAHQPALSRVPMGAREWGCAEVQSMGRVPRELAPW